MVLRQKRHVIHLALHWLAMLPLFRCGYDYDHASYSFFLLLHCMQEKMPEDEPLEEPSLDSDEAKQQACRAL